MSNTKERAELNTIQKNRARSEHIMVDKKLRPAILYKEKIWEEIQKRYFYEDNMFYASASLENYLPDIKNDSRAGHFQYAIIDNADKLIGYIEYQVNYYVSRASQFLIFSFADTPVQKYQFGTIVHQVIDELARELHSLEWLAVQGNPACRAYDKIMKRYHGQKLVIHDARRDKYGRYHNDFIYEILSIK